MFSRRLEGSKRVASVQIAAPVWPAGMRSALRRAQGRPFETRPGKRAAPQGERGRGGRVECHLIVLEL